MAACGNMLWYPIKITFNWFGLEDFKLRFYHLNFILCLYMYIYIHFFHFLNQDSCKENSKSPTQHISFRFFRYSRFT